MRPTESVRLSWRAVQAHKVRSTLTTLGIVIGIAAVITFVTLGASLQTNIINTVASHDATSITVMAAAGDSGIPRLVDEQAVFTEHDVTEFKAIPDVADVVPVGGIAASSVSHGDDATGREWIITTTPSYFDVRNRDFLAGRPFRLGTREVVVNEPATQMFDGEPVTVGDRLAFTRPVNRQTVPVTVVGVVEKTPRPAGSFQQAPDPKIYAPVRPLYRHTAFSPAAQTRQRVYLRVFVVAERVTAVDDVRARLSAYLHDRSDASQLKSKHYELRVVTRDQMVAELKQISTTLTAYVTGIAVISLVVGAIGIANVMLVSVTERTLEIGIMKAVGAQNWDVLQLFLVEAALLGGVGAVGGVIVGGLGGGVAAVLIGLPVTIRPDWIGIAVLAGILVGVIAGVYPAWAAARTDPIEALRHE